MDTLTLDELDRESTTFDRAVLATPDIDQFCSSTDWILPATQAFLPRREPWLRRGEHGYAALVRSYHPEGYYFLQPLEAIWGLACPLVGGDAAPLAAEFVAACREEVPREVLVLCGLVQGSPRFTALAERLSRRHRLALGPVTRRFCADLRGGVEGFLAARSANFRTSLKKARARAERAGIGFSAVPPCTPEDAEAIYERILAVEARSWKGLEGVGISIDEMQAFYRLMIRRLIGRGALRLMFARHEGRDIAYILGGILGSTYRGLQFSFDNDYAPYSLGNLAQYHQIIELCREGISDYDLGSDVDYKRRWGEPKLETVALIAFPHA